MKGKQMAAQKPENSLSGDLGSADAPSSLVRSAGSITVIRQKVLLYCGPGCAHEDRGDYAYYAPPYPNAPKAYIVDIVDTEGKIVGVWYAPFRNLPALESFAVIDLTPHSDHEVNLSVGSFPGMATQLEIFIFCLKWK
jgi:hypothetical protein